MRIANASRSRRFWRNLAIPGLGLAGLVLAAWAPSAEPQSEKWAVVLGGDTDGYLTPCGCTEPMSGGIRRRAAATLNLSFGVHTLILDNGSMASGTGVQDRMKAQTMAQALAKMHVAAINFTPADAAFGLGLALSLDALSGHRLSSDSVEQPDVQLQSHLVRGPFIVSGATVDADLLSSLVHGQPIAAAKAVQDLVEAAAESHKAPILMLHGSRADALALAKRFPALVLIQYRSSGDPPLHPEHVGNTLLATTGERGKSIIRLVWTESRFSGYTVMHLGPEIPDDPSVSRIFANYLNRVDREHMIDLFSRGKTAAYAGSAACASCHAEASRVWKASAHAHSLATLEEDKEGDESRDPDCAPCHVTGLASEAGFRSRLLTPQLAFVGCESCHGPALAHSVKPEIKLPTVGQQICITCHTSLNSPNFDFEKYWPRIEH